MFAEEVQQERQQLHVTLQRVSTGDRAELQPGYLPRAPRQLLKSWDGLPKVTQTIVLHA